MANESFEIQFERNGGILPVTGLVPGKGIILDGETDAWPLGVAFRLEPTSVGTRALFENIQRNEGWIGDHTFRLTPSVKEQRLRMEGFRPGLLPPGDYQLSVQVSGYVFHHQLKRFRIPSDGNFIVNLPEKPPSRRIRVHDLATFDSQIRDIVVRSALDGMAMTDWLSDARARRDSRRACALNLLCKLRSLRGDDGPLIQGVRRIIFADVDRIYLELEPRFAARLQSANFGEDAIIHTTHLKLLTKVPEGIDFRLNSLRERVQTISMQLAIAVPADGALAQFADADIDLGNPFVNPIGFFIHFGELIDPGKTDHIALHPKLDNDFRHYDVV